MFAILPLVLMTLLTQLAAGLAVFLFFREWRKARVVPGTSGEFWSGWLHVSGAALLGLVASMFYRQTPAMTGMAAPEPAWLSVPSLALILCAALAFLAWQKKGGAALGGLAALAGLAAVVFQSAAYTPGSLASLSGLLPLALFLLSSLALGAAFSQAAWARGPGALAGVTRVLRLSLGLMLLVLMLTPCLGGTGDAIMQASALAWMASQPYWAGVMAAAVALGLSFTGRGTALVQAVLTLVAVFGPRLTFFTDGVHLAVKMALPM